MRVLFGINIKHMFIVEKIVKYNTQQRIFIVREFYLSNRCVISVREVLEENLKSEMVQADKE